MHTRAGRTMGIALATALVAAGAGTAVADPGPVGLLGEAGMAGLGALADHGEATGSTDLSALEGLSDATALEGLLPTLGAGGTGSAEVYSFSDGVDRDSTLGWSGIGSLELGAADEFYRAPAEIPDTPGAVLRTQAVPMAWSLPGADGRSYPGDATRVMYASRDAHDRPIAVTGVLLTPAVEWRGAGERPLVVIAPGTQGQGDSCAPSKSISSLVTVTPPSGIALGYEAIPADVWLAQGATVMITDYEGLGTEGVHTYVNRDAQAHAVIDAARAARGVPDSGVGDATPIGLYGYSQGGGAVAAAAEDLGSYGPDVAGQVVGALVGAPPADLAATLDEVDGSSLAGVIGYALNAMRAVYPDEIGPVMDRHLNDRGRAMLDRVAEQCIGETVLQYGFARTEDFTVSGQSLAEVIAEEPVARAVMDRNRIGTVTPTVPIYLWGGTHDDVVPHGQVRQLAADWCSGGADVEFDPFVQPSVLRGAGVGHVLPMLGRQAQAVRWLGDRFAGAPTTGTC